MTQPEKSATSAPPAAADWIARGFFFALMVVAMVSMPLYPTVDLDASWRMALGRFFADGLQFGRDVVFTYGPLGFLMGKTYSGQHLFVLVLWQLLQAVLFSALIFRQGFRLSGYPRSIYFAFFFLLGIYYEDALQQIALAYAGFELLHSARGERRLLPALLALLMALYGLVKFTNCMLGMVFILCTAGLQLWERRPRAALWTVSWFFGGYITGWILCRQNPLNLPAYFHNSWEISQGYQETMGIPTPPGALPVGLAVLGLVIAHAAVFLLSQPDRSRAAATVAALGAFAYLNWKHGFVRADGHMIGFYYCMVAVATSYPVLLGNGPRFHRLQRCLLAAVILLSIAGVGIALPGVLRGVLGSVQERVYSNISRSLPPPSLLDEYTKVLDAQRITFDLPRSREVVGNGTLDVLGYEQAIALYNGFNYHPRPVFQSYSAYRPRLSRLNADFYASDRAPQFVLLKLHTIDDRLVTFDDAEVLHLLVQRYDYVLTERGYQLWQRRPGAFSASAVAPRPLRSAIIPVGTAWNVAEFSGQPLWVSVDLAPSLLGRLTGFFYKLPVVSLRVRDNHGNVSTYRMPLPIGRTGFIINPVVDDLVSYMRFAGGKPERLLSSLTVEIPPEDRKFFAGSAEFHLSSLPRSEAGKAFFLQQEKLRFHMFKCVPTAYEAQTPLSEGMIDGRPVMVFHAPSELLIDVPPGGKEFSGSFGFLPGAYTNGNNTDGAQFLVTWRIGNEEDILHDRFLDPIRKLSDRGLQSFRVMLPARTGGQLRLRILPGPTGNYSWDWTVWTGLDIQ